MSDTDDSVYFVGWDDHSDTEIETETEIAHLRAENERLRKALEDIVGLLCNPPRTPWDIGQAAATARRSLAQGEHRDH